MESEQLPNEGNLNSEVMKKVPMPRPLNHLAGRLWFRYRMPTDGLMQRAERLLSKRETSLKPGLDIGSHLNLKIPLLNKKI